MQLIHELSWLWKGIGIIALVSAIILIATILICIIAMILCARVPMLI